jgi:hypothetical protein
MNDTASLRLRFLTAMGIPLAAACHGRSAPPPPPADVVVAPLAPPDASTPADASTRAVAIDPRPRPRSEMCAVDEVREVACGVAAKPAHTSAPPYADCATSAAELTGFGFRIVAPTGGGKVTVDGMTLDTELTDLWRDDVRATFGDRSRAGSCCYSRCSKLDVAAEAGRPPGVVGVMDFGPGYQEKRSCLAAPERSTSVPAAELPDCPAAMAFHRPPLPDAADPLDPAGTREMRASNQHRPIYDWNNRHSCCYSVLQPLPGKHTRGRLFVCDGEARAAAPTASRAWSHTASIQVGALAPETRAHLARRWARDAATEHASVAAFARVSLQLLALGAPPDLIEDTHRAAIEEIAHARASYAAASAYAGAPIGPGPLDTRASDAPQTLVELARETLLHGCVGETVAAACARRSAELARDPALQEIYEGMAVDEESHAALAFRTLAWALRAGGEAVARAIEEMDLDAPLQGSDDGATPALADHGVLAPSTERRIRDLVVREVVRPCVRELLRAGPMS